MDEKEIKPEEPIGTGDEPEGSGDVPELEKFHPGIHPRPVNGYIKGRSKRRPWRSAKTKFGEPTRLMTVVVPKSLYEEVVKRSRVCRESISAIFRRIMTVEVGKPAMIPKLVKVPKSINLNAGIELAARRAEQHPQGVFKLANGKTIGEMIAEDIRACKISKPYDGVLDSIVIDID